MTTLLAVVALVIAQATPWARTDRPPVPAPLAASAEAAAPPLTPQAAVPPLTPQAAVPDSPLRVGAGGPYPTVPDAIAAAQPGDTIHVAAGVHHGPFTIDRPLVLVGEDGAVLDGGGRGSTVTVAADGVEIRGFTIRGSGRSLDHDDAAIKLDGCTGCRVIDNRIEAALHGVYLLRAARATIAGNVIHGDRTTGEARRGNGIHLFHSAGNRIERNEIRSVRDGIYFSFADANDVVENRVSGVRYGLHYMYSNDNRFTRNDFRRNAAGAAIMFSHRISFRDNIFADHTGYRAYGILLQTATGITAEGNRIVGNRVGLHLDNSLDNRITGNAIAHNGIGIDLLSSAEANLFAGNAIAGNRVAVRPARGGGENAWAEHGRGNWWGDPAVFDLDGDGVGDRPYRAGDPFATLAQGRPALEAFTGTLAARALAWAERAFPVFGLPTVVDPAPLARAPAGVSLEVPPDPTAEASSDDAHGWRVWRARGRAGQLPAGHGGDAHAGAHPADPHELVHHH